MNFGDWELFKITIVSLRAQEMTLVSQQDELPGRNVRFNNNPSNRSQQTQPERRASKLTHFYNYSPEQKLHSQ